MGTSYLAITDGTTTVRLDQPTTTMGMRADAGPQRLSGENIWGSDEMAIEPVRIFAQGATVDAMATRFQNLMQLIREAQNFRWTLWQTTPVYLKYAINETNYRYALVYDCTDLQFPDVMSEMVSRGWITDLTLNLLREHPWRDSVPGTWPTAKTLTAACGPASQVYGFVNNGLFSSVYTDTIFNYRAVGPVWSANLAGNPTMQMFQIGGTLPAAGDMMYIGGGGAADIVFPVDPAILGVYSATIVAEYSKGGGAWGSLTLGTDYGVWPSGDLTTFGAVAAPTGIFIKPKSDWAADTVNGVAGRWIRLRISALVSWTTSPQLNAAAYNVGVNHIEIPSTAFVGDAPPIIALFLGNIAEGIQTSPCFTTPSRILVGSRSRNLGANQFLPDIPLSNAYLPTGWTQTLGTDATNVADATAMNLKVLNVSFATDATYKARVTMVGASMLQYFFGRYRVFARVQQIGGANGDCTVGLRCQEQSALAGYPQYVLPPYTLQAHDLGWELADLTGDGYLSLPFSPVVANDPAAASLVFIMYASRTSGVSTLEMTDLLLMPIDEFSLDLRDPVSDVVYGASALHQSTALVADAGVMTNRTLKMMWLNAASAAASVPLETWVRAGDISKLEPNKQTRFYFLMMHYPTTWGTGPFMGPPTMGLYVQLFGHSTFQVLRGAT